MNINPTSIDCHNLEEEDFQNYDEFRELTTQEQAVQTQADRIFSKGSVLCGTHELKATAKIDSEVNEEYGKRESKGELSGTYIYESDDKKKKLEVETQTDTQGNCKVEVSSSIKW